MEKYKEGQVLEDDEFLFKLENVENKDLKRPRKVFLSKLTQKGEIPKCMIKWGNGWEIIDKTKINSWDNIKTVYPEIYIHKEENSNNWKIHGYRAGKSQDWVILEHPKGFLIEIYMSNFFKILKNDTIINGKLKQCYSWKGYKLIKK